MIVKAGGACVMSLTDGTSKMSKSDPANGSRINVLHPPDVIRDEIKCCKTDAVKGIDWDNAGRLDATNLLNIYAALQPGRTHLAGNVLDMSRTFPIPWIWAWTGLFWGRGRQLAC